MTAGGAISARSDLFVPNEAWYQLPPSSAGPAGLRGEARNTYNDGYM
jgi:hypothetical protein